jgi:hypothetical protein
MKNIITYILITAALTILTAAPIRAENVSAESASISKEVDSGAYDYRVANLRNFFAKYNSPLTDYAESFVIYADLNGLDYRLVPAITGVESTFGKRIPEDSYNAYGWANGAYSFTSWEDSIAHVSKTLKISYIDKGAPTIAKIAKRYAPPSLTWGRNVNIFIDRIDTLPLDFDII